MQMKSALNSFIYADIHWDNSVGRRNDGEVETFIGYFSLPSFIYRGSVFGTSPVPTNAQLGPLDGADLCLQT
jgi:hypothetical protein